MHEQYAGVDTMYAVVKNDYSEQAIENARMAGLEVSSVRANDLYVYLTSRSKGGIDDVFSGS